MAPWIQKETKIRFTYDLVKFLVLLIGILGEVFIKVVLSNGVDNIFSLRRVLVALIVVLRL